MKFLKNLGLLAVSAFAMTACVEPEADIQNFPDPDVDFTYNVADTTYVVDYYVVSNIQFHNTSAKTGNVIWNFGVPEDKFEVVDMSDINNPIIKYKEAGRYNVTLTIDGVGSKTYPILIYDIVPVLTIAHQSDSILEINKSTVSFNLELPNPENLKVKYVWNFPEGTTDANGVEFPNGQFIGYADENGNVDYPGEVKFRHVGSQKVLIQTHFDIDGVNRPLEDSYLNVQVGYSEEVPTLYYAQKDGNIKALKLIDPAVLAASGIKVFPYDMGVKAGNKPLNLCYGSTKAIADDETEVTNHWIYILDAGKQYYYVNDESDNLGDGKITAMGVDGSNVNTMVTNEGQAAFMDPFRGFVYNGQLYYSDRNNGVTAIPLETRGAVETQSESDASFRGSYFVKNDLIPYYNRGIAYGAISVDLYRTQDGTWWWGKNYSGNGIYRFTQNDIYATASDASAAAMPFPIVFSGIKLSTFTIDEKAKMIYVWRIEPASSGFYAYNLPDATSDGGKIASPVAKVTLAADPENTTADEQIHTCQFALAEDGKVYFAFRNNDGGDNAGLHSGIVYYDPADQKCHQYGETSDLGFGIVINPTKSKLF